jgi:hypothetical protein
MHTVTIPMKIKPAAYFIVGWPRNPETVNHVSRVWGPFDWNAENPLDDIAAIRRHFAAEYYIHVYATIEVPEEHYAEGEADNSWLVDGLDKQLPIDRKVKQ